MKHLIWILLITIVLSFVFGSIHEESYKDNPDYTYNEVTKTEPKVYVTNSGSFYHNASCGYLYKSSIAKGRGQAYEEGYSACSRCGGKPSGTITVTYKVKEPVPYGFKHIMGSVLLAGLTACFAYGIIYTIYEVYFTDGLGGKKERTKNTITTTKPISVPPNPPTLPIPPSTPTTTLTAREMLMKIMENLDDEVINSFAGKTVQHSKYGKGIIAYIENRKYIEVYFFEQQVSKKFVYPDAFADKHLTPVDFRLAINKNALDS